MSNYKILTTTAITIALLCRLLWGCTVAPNVQVTPTLTPRTDATPPRITTTPTPGAIGISREEDSQLTPSHPTQVTAQATTDAIVLTWLGTGDDRIRYYQVYRKVTDDGDWQPIAKLEITGDNRGRYEFKDTATEQGITYIYGVSAVDTYGNESTISESPAITSYGH